MIRLYKLHILIALLITAQFSLTKEEIGVASAVNKNTIDLTLEEERRLVQAGYKIIQNHTLETDSIGRAALLLVDGTSFSIGPNSSVTLDKFIYNPETAEGSLEVSSRGLLRLVGGKVTKKRPALIRTNSATVGIRGGITIVQTQGLSTSAAFVYGDEFLRKSRLRKSRLRKSHLRKSHLRNPKKKNQQKNKVKNLRKSPSKRHQNPPKKVTMKSSQKILMKVLQKALILLTQMRTVLKKVLVRQKILIMSKSKTMLLKQMMLLKQRLILSQMMLFQIIKKLELQLILILLQMRLTRPLMKQRKLLKVLLKIPPQ